MHGEVGEAREAERRVVRQTRKSEARQQEPCWELSGPRRRLPTLSWSRREVAVAGPGKMAAGGDSWGER